MALNKTEIFQKAREITGNKSDRAAGESFLDDPALEAALRPAIRDLNRAYGSADAQKEFSFTATVNQQKYVLTAVMPVDFAEIDEIYRSDAHVPDYELPDEHNSILRRQGAYNGEAVIHPGLQPEVFRTIIDQHRAAHSSRYGIRIKAGAIYLEPPPATTGVIIKGFYTATGFDIDTLPDETETALLYATVKVILNGMMNRVAGNKYSRAEMGETITQQLKTLREQRDHYTTEYAAELQKLAGR